MKFSKFFILLIILKLFNHPLYAAYNAPFVQEEMNYCHEIPNIYELNDVIISGLIEAGDANSDELQYSKYPYDLAVEILSVSQCFKIDPIILTGLVASESLFVPNLKNSIGATGLGQLTAPGIIEIGNQLGAPGLKLEEYAPANQINYFKSAIQCTVKENNLYKWPRFIIDNLPTLDVNVDHWWNYQTVKSLNSTNSMNSKLTKFLKNNRLMNLIYSSMLLKIFYSQARSNYESQAQNTLSYTQIMSILENSIYKYKGGGPSSTAKAQYKSLRMWSNRTLQIMNKTNSACYNLKYGT